MLRRKTVCPQRQADSSLLTRRKRHSRTLPDQSAGKCPYTKEFFGQPELTRAATVRCRWWKKALARIRRECSLWRGAGGLAEGSMKREAAGGLCP